MSPQDKLLQIFVLNTIFIPGTYGRDIGTSLPALLWKLVEVIPDGCMMRVGMTNPPYILEHLDEIARILATPRVYSFLHVPVQSGSDSVLGEMKREYNCKEFEQVVDVLREKVPGVTIATDIICGFPTETEADFEETMKLCAKYQFPSLFINQFFPRPGTPAARMPRIPANLVKTRTKRLTDLFNSYQPYAHKVHEVQTVLVTEISHDRQHYVGHNKFYEQVLLPMKENLLGKSVQVRITGATKFSVFGQLLDENEATWLAATSKNVTNRQLMSQGLSTNCEDYGDEHRQDVAGTKEDSANGSYLVIALIALALAIVCRFGWKMLHEYSD